MRELARACLGLGIVHYNEEITRYGSLGPNEYAELANLDNFWGSKLGDPGFAWWMELQRLTPGMAHLVLDNLLVPSMMLGGKGAFSILVCLSPRFALEMYAACLQGDWEKALRMQNDCNRFFNAVYEPLMTQGYSDPAIDKALMNAFGFVPGGVTRPPLLAVPKNLEREIMRRVEAEFRFLLE